MRTATTILQILIRATWLILLVLGLLFWTGRAPSLISLHELLGSLFVILLWVLAFIGMRCGAGRALVAVLFIWGLVVLFVGMTQTGILIGGAHWTIETLHLLVAVAAIGIAEALGGRIKRRLAQTT